MTQPLADRLIPWTVRQLRAEAAVRLRVRRAAPPLRRAAGVCVSLTSYPARITSARLVLESLLSQSVAAEEVVLVLAHSEWKAAALPDWIGPMRGRGLRVLWSDVDARSYGKLLPLLAERPDAVIVTADDDTLYPRRWLEGLLEASVRRPGVIIGYRGLEVALEGAGAAPYIRWPHAGPDTPNARRHLTGVGGVLYPPRTLAAEVSDITRATALCPTNDDVWFHAMSLAAGSAVATVSPWFREFPQLRGSQGAGALMATNVGGGAVDRQFAAVFDHFNLWEALRA